MAIWELRGWSHDKKAYCCTEEAKDCPRLKNKTWALCKLQVFFPPQNNKTHVLQQFPRYFVRKALFACVFFSLAARTATPASKSPRAPIGERSTGSAQLLTQTQTSSKHRIKDSRAPPPWRFGGSELNVCLKSRTSQLMWNIDVAMSAVFRLRRLPHAD